MKNLNVWLGSALVALAASSTAMAQLAAIDVSDLETGLGNQLAPIGLVAVAGLALAVAIVAYKWIKRAL